MVLDFYYNRVSGVECSHVIFGDVFFLLDRAHEVWKLLLKSFSFLEPAPAVAEELFPMLGQGYEGL